MIEKLEGLIDAIDAESKNPSPSHQNLARLVAMFCRELMNAIPVFVQSPVEEVATPQDQPESTPEPEEVQEPTKPKALKKHKAKKG